MKAGHPPRAGEIIYSNGNIVATATTNVTGFCLFATKGLLTPTAYTVGVTGLPAGYSTPDLSSPTFA